MLVVAASAFVAFAPATASAGLVSCGASDQPFIPWGDYTSYMLAPNGDAESGSQNWTFAGGAGVASGNETFYVEGAGDSHSVRIPAGGSATIDHPCVTIASLWMRFFARNAGRAGAPLQIRLVYRGLLGTVLSIVDVNGDIQTGSAWAPVDKQLMSGGLLGPLTATSMQIRLSVPSGSGGDIRVDDVNVDPMGHI